MSAQVVGLAAAALVVANEVTSGDGSTLVGLVSGKSSTSDAHSALIRLGLMTAGVVVLAVGASQSSPWPALITVLLIGLWALWALNTFTGAKKAKTTSSSPSQGATLA